MYLVYRTITYYPTTFFIYLKKTPQGEIALTFRSLVSFTILFVCKNFHLIITVDRC